MGEQESMDRIEGKLDALTNLVTELRIHVAANLVTRDEFKALQTETRDNRRWVIGTALALVTAIGTVGVLVA